MHVIKLREEDIVTRDISTEERDLAVYLEILAMIDEELQRT